MTTSPPPFMLPMQNPPWMLVRIALETRHHHTQADEDRLTLMDACSPAEYRAFLARTYGFESVVEAAMVGIPGPVGALVASRAKTALLRQDLEALGVKPAELDQLPRCTTVKVIATPSQALGYLFVLERHTLLAGLIRRQLARRLPAEIKAASRYLAAYGGSPGLHLRQLGDALGAQARIAANAPSRIVTAANEVFRSQRQWYLASGSFPAASHDRRVRWAG
ncbi:MAG: biliverdin-producing heme oxygenase [Deltaproteobacteria bacterium]|nr:biliverdin-producing heme oxygenase [Deltaproteobacteria bacterium]